MADGVTDTSHWEDVAGVASALLGAAPHRKRASTPADPATLHVHLHRRSSSLVSELTIDGIHDGDDCCFKCPRVLQPVCCSPDVLNSPTGTSVLQPPSTPSTCGSQPAVLQQQPDNNRAAALPPSPVLKGSAPSQRMQLTLLPQPWQRQPPRLACRSCPGALGLASPRSPAVAAAGAARPAMSGMHPPASPGVLSGSHSCGSPATAAAAAAAALPPVQLNSLMLVASQLAGTGNGSSSPAAGAPGHSCSPLLPATQASLTATTASVVAAELTAAAMAGQAAAAGSQLVAAAAAAAREDAAAAAAEADLCDCQQQPKQLELPSWLRSGSAGLAASAAICRASLLNTTAALARLSQQQQQQPRQARMLGAQPDSTTARVAAALPSVPELQGACMQGVGVPMALGVPVSGAVVMGMPVHCQQQHEAAAPAGCCATGRLFDFKASGACAVGQLCVSSLRVPTPACGGQQLMEQGSMQCDDATSCCSTPRSGAAAAAAMPSEDVRQVADAAARLLLSSSGSRRRRCCWEVEAMEEQCGDAMESDEESPEITSAAAAAAAAAEMGVGWGREAACAQQLAMATGDAAACAVVVVVDVAAKRSSGSSKEAPRLVGLAACGLAAPALSAGCCGES